MSTPEDQCVPVEPDVDGIRVYTRDGFQGNEEGSVVLRRDSRRETFTYNCNQVSVFISMIMLRSSL